MIRKSAAIDRFLKENPQLRERRFGLPDIGRRLITRNSIRRFKPLRMQSTFMVTKCGMKTLL